LLIYFTFYFHQKYSFEFIHQSNILLKVHDANNEVTITGILFFLLKTITYNETND